MPHCSSVLAAIAAGIWGNGRSCRNLGFRIHQRLAGTETVVPPPADHSTNAERLQGSDIKLELLVFLSPIWNVLVENVNLPQSLIRVGYPELGLPGVTAFHIVLSPDSRSHGFEPGVDCFKFVLAG